MHKLIVDAMIGDNKYHVYVVLYEWLLARADGTYKSDVLAELATITSLSRDKVYRKLMVLQNLGLIWKMPTYNVWLIHRTPPADVVPIMSALAKNEAWIEKDHVYTADGEVDFSKQVEARTIQARKIVSARAIKAVGNNPKEVMAAMQGIYTIELLTDPRLDESTPHSTITNTSLVLPHAEEFLSRIDDPNSTILTNSTAETTATNTKRLDKVTTNSIDTHRTDIPLTQPLIEQLPLIETPTIIDEWFKHWQTACKRPTSRLTPRRKAVMKKALAAGITREQGIQAIDYVASNPFFSGANDRGGDYTDIMTIFRNPERVEQYSRQLGLTRPITQQVATQQLRPNQPAKPGRKF